MAYEDILYEKTGHIARITFNRPRYLNAMRGQTMTEFIDACHDAAHDHQIGVVVVTGAGNRAFSSGGDVKWERDIGAGVNWGPQIDFYRCVRLIPKPVIAVVRGYCIGGANVLAALCDLTIASETALFGQVGPRMGSFNALGTAYLSRVVGEKKAKEMWFLCKQYNAKEALEMGLVNKVVPDDKLEAEVNAWCEEILKLSPSALSAVKLHFNADSERLMAMMDIGMHAVGLYQSGPEAQEGLNAFLEKRTPDFWKLRSNMVGLK